MKQHINDTSFGSITINGKEYNHDIIFRLDGSIEKRKKKLSKKIYGTSHTISLDEAKFVFEKGAEMIIIGGGQYGRVNLSEEAADYFEKKDCRIKILATPDAIKVWNNEHGKQIGLFHITC